MEKEQSLQYKILLIGTFATCRDRYVHALESSGYHAATAEHLKSAQRALDQDDPYSIVIIDRSDDLQGEMHFLAHLKISSPATQVILINKTTSVLSSFEAQQYGVFWHLHDHIEVDELLYLVAKGCVMYELAKDNISLRSAVRSLEPTLSDTMKTESMKQLLNRAERVAALDATVLLTGESGTGKTTIAGFLHQASHRHNGPFISISCATIPRDLIEAELFGHEKGAYTGATSSRPGSLELADGGTIFLDEIGELPIDLQPKLLTFLQDRIIRRIGGIKTKKIDVRIICATNKDLAEMVNQRTFRQDLYYRINVLGLEIPPLRERKNDIPQLVEHILRNIEKNRGSHSFSIDREALKSLVSYNWPGNIRELENTLERATAFAESTTIYETDLKLPAHLSGHLPQDLNTSPISLVGTTLEEMEKRLITETIAACRGDKAEAANMLGISLKTIYNKLNRYQIRL